MTSGSGGASSSGHDADQPGAERLTSVPHVDSSGGGGVGAAVAPAEPAGHSVKAMPWWQETVLLVGTAVVLALLIKTFFLQAFYIPSGSMRDTLKVDDRILVEKVSYWFGDVSRGDIVVFDDPANWLGEEDGHVPGNAITKAMSRIGLYPSGGHLVKRVIGVGGDAVSCRQGTVMVNGAALQENSYVTLSQTACDGKWSVIVPSDHIWVLGDNRQESADSRAHTGDPGGGFIPVSDVVGKAFVVVWPIDRWQFIDRPSTFSNPALDQAAMISGASLGFGGLAVPALVRRRRDRDRRG